MMAQPVPHQTPDKKRVKVYELRNNDWFDRGTGFCTAAFVTIEDGQPKEPRVIVESEDHPDRLLLETKIVKDDGFQKQQDTLIVWTDNGVDMALSFQEADGCALIWKFIDGVQQTFQSVMGGPDDGLSDDIAIEMPAAIQLPAADLGTLCELESNMRIMSSTANGRDALTKAIMSDDYISKLIPLVEIAEDLESLPDLHRLCNIMKTVLLLNDTSIIEHAVSDDCVLGVVGALEYDPDFPSHKANHRQWLNSQGRYKEVVRIEDDQIRRKIHQTYRLQYLKDVVLARILDDPTFSVLNSLIFFNQVDIVQHLQNNSGFLNDLFSIFADPSEEQLRKKEAVLFIQQCCAIAKNLQPPARQNLYNNFLSHGLLRVINFGLRNLDVTVRVGATDILVSMIDHDPQMIRHTIYRQIQEKQQPLTDTLIDLLLVEVDLGIKSQVSDALKVLLDPTPPGGPPETRSEFIIGQPRGRPQVAIDPQQELFLTHFYEHSAVRLFKPLLDLEKRAELRFNVLHDGIFGYLNDILCFYIRQHQHRSKYFLLQHNIAQRFNRLLSCKEKHLQLVAIRFFRQLVVLQDDFYIKHLADKQILGPVLDVLLRTMPRDNLLCSACLDLFGLIYKENIKELIKHVVENYREKVMALSYIDTFREILSRYDQSQGFTAVVEPYFMEPEDEVGRRPMNAGARGGMMEHLTVEHQSHQEDYLNTSDDDDENHARPPNQALLSNGNNTTKPLVEYTSDEEGEDSGGDSVMTTGADQPLPDDHAKENQAPPTTPGSIAAVTPPPERLSEKRRREEDEDDPIDKLQYHKRRNSSVSSTNSAVSVGSTMGLRKKKAFGGSRDASPNRGGPKKIAISISSTIKSITAKSSTSANEDSGK
ncbi:component of IIS longevity pathway SMK-1-domain-containing protein [Lasiosphaeria miniovina]|uniref:Component of IIS longevity pathway SMK-1-domain-containing protein n=1 Tax=Lasiosphaeria miniovina TaxID=1954250 RepID=A0AA40ALY0_9PEZI|nr:component of IIS longevity pathway SMK-1-domain-containing protein [Lasiosphaeria miniovina]KAK0718285.1 component of IIS longevity pathway SMK-1-domain-containing protein [Lasiosphaeria miniovina]